MAKPPLTRATLALFAGASGDHNHIHIDTDFARASGFEDVFAQGMLGMAYAAQLFTANFPAGSLRSFDIRFLDLIRVHDQIECIAELIESEPSDGGLVARYAVTALNQTGETRLAGEAVVEMRTPAIAEEGMPDTNAS